MQNQHTIADPKNKSSSLIHTVGTGQAVKLTHPIAKKINNIDKIPVLCSITERSKIELLFHVKSIK